MSKRKIFAELMEGVAAMGAQRQGKLTLRNYKVKVDADAKARREGRSNSNETAEQ